MYSAQKRKFGDVSKVALYPQLITVLMGLIPMYQSPFESPRHSFPAFQTFLTCPLSNQSSFLDHLVCYIYVIWYGNINNKTILGALVISGEQMVYHCLKAIASEYCRLSKVHAHTNFLQVGIDTITNVHKGIPYHGISYILFEPTFCNH